jgi:FSR family fosmidomycin resistance protein-like MFS transporter
MPLLGLVADRHGPRGALLVLTVIPLLAIDLDPAARAGAHRARRHRRAARR